MNFSELDKEYQRLKGQFEADTLAEEDFKSRLKELMIQDEEGRWWMIGHETGQWFVHDGENWVRGEPPHAARPRRDEAEPRHTTRGDRGLRKVPAWGWVLGGLIGLMVLICALVSFVSVLGGGGQPDRPPDGLEGGQSSGEVLLSDSFTLESSGWEIGDYTSGRVGYWNGIYFVTSLGDGATMWGFANRGFDDVDIKVRLQQVSGPSNNNNDYGVICRVQADGEGYFFLISGDGFYTILRADAEDSYDNLIDWTPSNVINQGNSTNDILVSCNGDQLSLTVNGELLASVKDSRYKSGDIALTATSYEAESTEIHFDDILVTRP